MADRAGCSLLLEGLGLEPRRDLPLPGHLVDHVDRLVLAVRAGDAEPHREPAPEAEPPLLRDRPREDERAPGHLVVDAAGLPDAVHEYLEVTGYVRRQVHPRALGHLHRMPARCAGSCRSSCWSCCSHWWRRAPRLPETAASRRRRRTRRTHIESTTPTTSFSASQPGSSCSSRRCSSSSCGATAAGEDRARSRARRCTATRGSS